MNDKSLRRSALLIAAVSSFLTPFMASSINIALPAIGREFRMDAVVLSWVPTSYLLAAAMFLVPLGRFADIYGRKMVFTWGIGVFTLSSLLIAFSPSSSVLIAFRVVQGLGSAMIFGTSMAIITSVFPPQQRGRVLGITVSAVYLGLSFGPFLGGLLTQQLGWRSIFLANVPVGFVVIYLAARKLKGEWAEAQGEKFDFPGAVIYGLALVALMYGLSLLPSVSGGLLILGGLGGLAAFVSRETRISSPLLQVGLLAGNKAFAFSNAAALINYSATFAVTFLMSLYLQYIKGLAPQQAGLVLVVQPVIMAAFSPAAGKLSDTIEPRIVASLGMALSAAGLFLFTFVKADTHMGFIVAGLALLGFGFALFSSPNTNAVMSSIEKRFYGVGSAILGTMRLTGQMLSMGIAMVIFAVRIGSVRITPQYYPVFLSSARTAFVIFSALCLGGVFASLARGKVR